MAQTGQRGSTPVSPANRTGKLYQQQLREKQARDEAASASPEQTRREVYTAVFDATWPRAFEAGWKAAVEVLRDLYRSEGFGAVQEFLDELDEGDDTKDEDE